VASSTEIPLIRPAVGERALCLLLPFSFFLSLSIFSFVVGVELKGTRVILAKLAHFSAAAITPAKRGKQK